MIDINSFVSTLTQRDTSALFASNSKAKKAKAVKKAVKAAQTAQTAQFKVEAVLDDGQDVHVSETIGNRVEAMKALAEGRAASLSGLTVSITVKNGDDVSTFTYVDGKRV